MARRDSAARRLGGSADRDSTSGRGSTAGPGGTGASRRPGAEPPNRRFAGHSLELDRIIHERVRLGIVSALAVNKALSFNELKQLLEVTDGNLSVHARKLEEAGYVECLKSFADRMPRTEYRLTGKGREALERYLAHMEGLIRATRGR